MSITTSSPNTPERRPEALAQAMETAQRQTESPGKEDQQEESAENTEGQQGESTENAEKSGEQQEVLEESKDATSEHAEETASALLSNEHQSEESKKLQQSLIEEIEKITEEKRKEDEEKLKNASIKDIRFKMSLLGEDEEKIQEEMTRRLAQYTTKQEDGGLVLNYSKFNALSGKDHEMEIGLGDIMPPQYTRVLVITRDGRRRFGRRTITMHRGMERVGYEDEETKSYLATFSGEVVYVLDPPLTSPEELKELIEKEKTSRKKTESSYDESVRRRSSSSDRFAYSEEDYARSEGIETQENLSLKDSAISGMNRHIAGRQFWDYRGVKINVEVGERKFSWEHDQSLSEGENIYNYSKAVCEAHGMGNMINAVWAIIRKESSFNPFATNERSTATGLAQNLEKSWRTFIGRASNTSDPFVSTLLPSAYKQGIEYDGVGASKPPRNLSTNPYPPESDYRNYSRCNPYLSVYSVIMGIKRKAKNYEIQSHKTGITNFNSLRTEDQLRLLYLSHHDGGAGGPAMLAFMKYLSSIGVDISNREAVRQFVVSGTENSKTALDLLATNQRARVYERAVNEDDAFLRSWYFSCQKVVKYATNNQGFYDVSIPKTA